MDDKDLLLVLTICKLLGASKTVKDAENAHQWAIEEVVKRRRFEARSHSEPEDRF